MEPHLLFYAGADYIIGLAQAAVFVDPYFGYDKKGDSLSPFGCTFNSGQHRVNDVFGQVLVPGRNKNFVSGNGIGPVRVLHSRSGQCSHITAGFGLGEQHGAPPFRGVKVSQKQLFLTVRSEQFDHFPGTVAQGRITGESKVGSQ